MGFVLAVLFFVLTFTTSPWWLLPLGAVLFAEDRTKTFWVAATVVVVLALTVSPAWFFALLLVPLFAD